MQDINNNQNTGPLPLGIPVVKTTLSFDSSIYTDKKIETSKQAVEYISRYVMDLPEECVYALICNGYFQPLCVTKVGSGTLAALEVSIRDIVRTALLCNGFSVTLIHNHPVSDKYALPKPTKEDFTFVGRCVSVLGACDMLLYDSIIVQPSPDGICRMYSMREHSGIGKKFVPLRMEDIQKFMPDFEKEENILWQNLPQEIPSFTELMKGPDTIDIPIEEPCR